MSLSDLEADNTILPEPATRGEMQKLFDAIDRRLRDASVEATSNEARAEHLYHVVLQSANAALRAHDYRLGSMEGAHVLTLESLADTVGTDAVTIRFFQQLRKRRNADLYRGEDLVSDSQLAEMDKHARQLAKEIRDYIAKLRPELFSGSGSS